MAIKGTKKQARKRHRQSEVRRVRNRSVRTRVRRQMRRMRRAVEAGDSTEVARLLPETFSVIDNGRRRGVIHHRTASRYKARMALQANRVLLERNG